MALMQWDPFAEMVSLREAVNRLFEESFVPSVPGRFAGLAPLDVYEEGDAYILEAALPGLAPEAIEVSILGNQVTLRGTYPEPPAERRYLRRERPSGRFERVVTLPTDLDAEHVEARCEHGLLRLVIPKAAAARARRIPISTGPAMRQDLPPAVEPHV
ncbi:MAG TPA: Hsp20/alpha crystallin family protein [Chloroflexota bacterium]|nr:Hsp20/alpha crystallin family protein [Chloroflexota bacterium]